MLKALSVTAAIEIADAALAWSRDEQAMVRYLNVGARGCDRPALQLATAADVAAFDSPERRRVEALVAALPIAARQELIALLWVANSLTPSYEKSLRRAGFIPPEAQVGYILGRRLERLIPAALEKLGLKP